MAPAENHLRRWTKEEEEKLMAMKNDNRSIKEIADALGRSKRAIECRIDKIGEKIREIPMSTYEERISENRFEARRLFSMLAKVSPSTLVVEYLLERNEKTKLDGIIQAVKEAYPNDTLYPVCVKSSSRPDTGDTITVKALRHDGKVIFVGEIQGEHPLDWMKSRLGLDARAIARSNGKKANKRVELLFSTGVIVQMPTNLNVIVIDDIEFECGIEVDGATLDGRRTAEGPAVTKRHTFNATDGCGYFSPDLCKVLGDPSIIAVQARFKGMKGMWVRHNDLPPNTMVCRRSQVKWDLPPDQERGRFGLMFQVLEAARSDPFRGAKVYHIPRKSVGMGLMLAHSLMGAGVPVSVLAREVVKGSRARYGVHQVPSDEDIEQRGPVQAISFKRKGSSEDNDNLFFNAMTTMRNSQVPPFHFHTIAKVVHDRFAARCRLAEDPKKQAADGPQKKGKKKPQYPFTGLHTAFAVVCPQLELTPSGNAGTAVTETDVLAPYEIYFHPYREDKPVVGPVLVTRSPSTHPGDWVLMDAVDRPQYSGMKNVAIFSAHARQKHRSTPPAICRMNGGDFDGDKVFIMTNSAVVAAVRSKAGPDAHVLFPAADYFTPVPSFGAATYALAMQQAMPMENRCGMIYNIWSRLCECGLSSGPEARHIARKYAIELDHPGSFDYPVVKHLKEMAERATMIHVANHGCETSTRPLDDAVMLFLATQSAVDTVSQDARQTRSLKRAAGINTDAVTAKSNPTAWHAARHSPATVCRISTGGYDMARFIAMDHDSSVSWQLVVAPTRPADAPWVPDEDLKRLARIFTPVPMKDVTRMLSLCDVRGPFNDAVMAVQKTAKAQDGMRVVKSDKDVPRDELLRRADARLKAAPVGLDTASEDLLARLCSGYPLLSRRCTQCRLVAPPDMEYADDRDMTVPAVPLIFFSGFFSVQLCPYCHASIDDAPISKDELAANVVRLYELLPYEPPILVKPSLLPRFPASVPEGDLVVYTDGACTGIGTTHARAGLGVFLTTRERAKRIPKESQIDDDPAVLARMGMVCLPLLAEPGAAEQHIDRAELGAIVALCGILRALPTRRTAVVYIDSDDVLDFVQYETDGKTLKVPDRDLNTARGVIEAATGAGHALRFETISAHAGNLNEFADKAAKIGVARDCARFVRDFAELANPDSYEVSVMEDL
ncbi:RNA-dependent RNA polymerase, eukaryotic-type [Carpediemonas membranifera]|uniref:RNA-dependent RNA polymerase n=1 Tax=Carpediemonas membranifera TaxID=201153 RepID=A0A8J6E626_9EUKA|nr:RNA-dependent RNA polymerase, eukaryotic-type [Carpediemonas membranifera]|eukprot:KAG9396607.1 RNA-dependent RNA polymerase, eukaryotic-type [Carpediemonas membranifera]